jgi:glycosyltransferase involved in cell wall biosynthesis
VKKIYFTVTNDLSYDQRMHRICHTLASNNYDITLVGRQLANSLKLETKSFKQKRLKCIFNTGFLFYFEYNLRLLVYLYSKKMDGICAIDLDTILPCLAISKLKNIVRVYDAHEFFTEMKEVRSRPMVQKVWLRIEKIAVPKFKYGYTVGNGLATLFAEKYNRNYEVIRNLPLLQPLQTSASTSNEKFIFYGGAVNEARGFESLIPAMKNINYKLIIAGDGNFFEKAQELVKRYNIKNKIEFRGMVTPSELKSLAEKATLGISLVEKDGLSQFYSLPNKLFDYIHATLPQITMNYPEYAHINNQYKIAVLIEDLNPTTIAEAVNSTLENELLLNELKQNCMKAREELNWQKEEQNLIMFYKNIFN